MACCCMRSCCCSAWISSFMEASCADSGSRFTTGLFRMLRARLAYLSVFRDSSMLSSAPLQQAIITVLLLPPKESCSKRVSLDSRYGTCPPRFDSSPSAEMTLPSASSPQLMLMPSFIRPPTAAVFLLRSEPARSTRWNLAIMNSGRASVAASAEAAAVECCSRVMVKMAWEREEDAFISVAPVARAPEPRNKSLASSSSLVATSSLTPATKISPFSRSRM
mmetsp:Transcript_28227/g.53753  ORF Transcript_28227/g.53753 Transcript_28227/m.53753 type:complete len:221 (-) Transcript_28227:406-1068(-)